MVLTIIQARMGSTRLPEKVLAPIDGYPMLWHVLNRLADIPLIDKMVVATTDLSTDDPIASFCQKAGFQWFRGNEADVLDRFYRAAHRYGADSIVRITGDCPLIDPRIVEKVINVYRDGKWDYVSNTIERTFPDGLDVEVFSFSALEEAWQKTTLMSEREHVTPYIWKNRECFKQAQVTQKNDLSDLRWTVDEPEDLEVVRRIYQALFEEGRVFLMKDVLRLIAQHPELSTINSGFVSNEGYLKSIREDRVVRTASGVTLGGIPNGQG